MRSKVEKITDRKGQVDYLLTFLPREFLPYVGLENDIVARQVVAMMVPLLVDTAFGRAWADERPALLQRARRANRRLQRLAHRLYADPRRPRWQFIGEFQNGHCMERIFIGRGDQLLHPSKSNGVVLWGGSRKSPNGAFGDFTILTNTALQSFISLADEFVGTHSKKKKRT